MIIKQDFHNHTHASRCARETATVAAAIGSLEQMGFEAIGFCDHLYPETDCARHLKMMREEISRCPTKMQVYVGLEVEMLAPGVLDATQQHLRGFDYVAVASPHYQNPRVLQPLRYDYIVAAQNALDYFISTAAIAFVDVIVHPFDARSLKEYRTDFVLAEALKLLERKHYLPIIDLLIQNNIAIELTERLRHIDYFIALEPFLSLCRDSGVKFTLGSDAHAPEHYGSILRAADALKQLRITEDMLWWPAVTV